MTEKQGRKRRGSTGRTSEHRTNRWGGGLMAGEVLGVAEIERIIERTVEWDAMCESLYGADKAAQTIAQRIRPERNEGEAYPCLEIIGELDTWQLNMHPTFSSRLVPEMSILFKALKDGHTLTLGDEIVKQLDKAEGPPPARRKLRTYARVRVDFYVVEEEK